MSIQQHHADLSERSRQITCNLVISPFCLSTNILLFSRCWVKDDKEGWIGATVEDKTVADNKVTITLKTEKDDVS